MILYIMGLMMGISSCTHKDLCYVHPHYSHVRVVINWEDTPALIVREMRTNFILSQGNFEIGRNDMDKYGGIIETMPNNSYMAMCYNYSATESIYFSNEEDDYFTAYTLSETRSSYKQQYPEEVLISEPDQLYLDKIAEVEVMEVPDGEVQEVMFYPTERLVQYTFEIRKVKGVRYVNSIGMACSGVSRSYSMIDEKASDMAATVLFNGNKDSDAETIYGSFKIFGHCEDGSQLNHLSVEVRYTATKDDNGYRTMRWDVTNQMHDETNNKHIILEWDTEFVPPSDDGAGMDAKVDPWDEVWIPVEM